ncbi:hypothetical protein ABK040_015295 [Willaertia magna]
MLKKLLGKEETYPENQQNQAIKQNKNLEDASTTLNSHEDDTTSTVSSLSSINDLSYSNLKVAEFASLTPEEVDEQYIEMLVDIGVPEGVRESETKKSTNAKIRELIRYKESKKEAFEEQEEDEEHATNILTEWEQKGYDLHTLEIIHVLIRTAPTRFVNQFIMNGGIKAISECMALTNVLSNNRSQDELQKQALCVSSINALVHTNIGTDEVLSVTHSVRNLALIIDTPNINTASQCLHILSTLSAWSMQGFALVMDAFNHYKLIKREKKRFFDVVQRVQETKDLEYKLAAMILFNSLLTNAPDEGSKTLIKKEMRNLGMVELVDELKNEMADSMYVVGENEESLLNLGEQIEIFETKMSGVNEEQSAALKDLSDPVEIVKLLQLMLNEESMTSMLNILQKLLSMILKMKEGQIQPQNVVKDWKNMLMLLRRGLKQSRDTGNVELWTLLEIKLEEQVKINQNLIIDIEDQQMKKQQEHKKEVDSKSFELKEKEAAVREIVETFEEKRVALQQEHDKIHHRLEEIRIELEKVNFELSEHKVKRDTLLEEKSTWEKKLDGPTSSDESIKTQLETIKKEVEKVEKEGKEKSEKLREEKKKLEDEETKLKTAITNIEKEIETIKKNPIKVVVPAKTTAPTTTTTTTTAPSGNVPPPPGTTGNVPPPPGDFGGNVPPPPFTGGGNVPPPPFTGGSVPPPPGDFGGGNVPPPPFGTGNVPPPPFGNVPPPPGGDFGNVPPPPFGSVPPPPGGGNVPPPPFGNVPPPPGGGNVPPPPFGNVPPPPGGGGIPMPPGMTGVPPPPGGGGIPMPPGMTGIPMPPGTGVPMPPGMTGVPMPPGFGRGVPMAPMFGGGMMGRGRGVGDGLPTLPDKAPKESTRNVHFDQIQKTTIKNTIFVTKGVAEKTNKIISDIDLDALTLSFSTKKKETTETQPKPTKEKKEVKSLLDAKRSYAVSLQLGSLRGITYQNLRKAIIELDETVVTGDNMGTIKQIAPEQEEIDTVMGYDGPEDELAEPDKFFRVMNGIPNLKGRLDAWEFKFKFPEITSKIRPDIQNMTLACKEMQDSKKFLKLLSIILTIGNFLNGKQKNKISFGFKLKSLAKLADTKSGDGKSSLLQYIVKFIANSEKHADVLEFDKELEHIQAATRVMINSLEEDTEEVKKGFDIVKQQIQKAKDDSVEGDKFVEKMGPFAEKVENTLKKINEDMEKMKQDLGELAELYNESKDDLLKEPDKFFVMIDQFIQQFKQAHEKNVQLAKAEEKKKKAEEEKLKKEKLMEKQMKAGTNAGNRIDLTKKKETKAPPTVTRGKTEL